jgi:hypothetical protein
LCNNKKVWIFNIQTLCVLESQCLDRRIPDEFSLGKEIVAWETRRNDQNATIQWAFTKVKAEKTFSKNQSYLASWGTRHY